MTRDNVSDDFDRLFVRQDLFVDNIATLVF